MKHDVQKLIEFLRTPFPYVFVILNLLISFILLNSNDFLSDLQARELSVYTNNGEIHTSSGVKISFCTYGGNYLFFDQLVDIAYGFTFLFSSMAYASTIYTMSSLNSFLPAMSLESYDFLTGFIFVYFNLNNAIFISYILYCFHDIFTQNEAYKNRYQTIFTNPELSAA